MDHIRQAIERAKESHAVNAQLKPQTAQPAAVAAAARPPSSNEVKLNEAHLESKRVVSHDIADPRSKSFDMLRTQVLQTMDLKSWQLIGITSPTAGCGKTMVAANLALSIARQPHRSVLLADLDLQKPQVANTLGLNCEEGVLGVLEGRTTLQNALVQAHIGNERLTVLPCARATLKSSAWMASQAMTALLQEIKRDFRASTVILDLPPVLTSDDVISILPQIDCMLFVAAAGTSTVAQIKECNKHLQAASIVRVVLNKAADTTTSYYSRYYGEDRKSDKRRAAR